nr:hypothetical protein CFP56_56969 [Quercus suber]
MLPTTFRRLTWMAVRLLRVWRACTDATGGGLGGSTREAETGVTPEIGSKGGKMKLRPKMSARLVCGGARVEDVGGWISKKGGGRWVGGTEGELGGRIAGEVEGAR